MLNIIAIEGIDRIGKSTFIKELNTRLSAILDTRHRITVQKPKIGLNTIDKNNYPLSSIENIFEIRNIGLFEELLVWADYMKCHDDVIIRDRFNFSELAYCDALRTHTYDITLQSNQNARELYYEWNEWFETKLNENANVICITFVLDTASYPNEDEVVSAKDLIDVNENFKLIFNKSKFTNKHLIELHKDANTGLTNIMDYVDYVINVLLCGNPIGDSSCVYNKSKSTYNSYITCNFNGRQCVVFNANGHLINIGYIENHKVHIDYEYAEYKDPIKFTMSYAEAIISLNHLVKFMDTYDDITYEDARLHIDSFLCINEPVTI